MALPSRFELVVRPDASVRHHTGGAVDEGTVVALDASIGGQIDATNTMVQACAAMAPADVEAWNGVYQAFQAVRSDWLAWKKQADSISAWDVVSTIAAKFTNGQFVDRYNAGVNGQSFLEAARVTQTKATMACPSLQGTVPTPAPTPAPSTPSSSNTAPPTGPAGSWLCTTFGINCTPAAPSAPPSTGWPDAIKWGAILGLGLLAMWYVGPLIATIAGVGAGAIRKRATSSDEFEPVAMFKKGFGNMPVEPVAKPYVESLQFGDVARDDVLALLGTGQE